MTLAWQQDWLKFGKAPIKYWWAINDTRNTVKGAAVATTVSSLCCVHVSEGNKCDSCQGMFNSRSFIQQVRGNKQVPTHRGMSKVMQRSHVLSSHLCGALSACLASVYPYLKSHVGVEWFHRWYSIKKSPLSKGWQMASPQACKWNITFAMSHFCF